MLRPKLPLATVRTGRYSKGKRSAQVETASDASDMEPNQDNESPLVEWTDLPDHILGNIYTFLGWKDRLNLSLVCNRWKGGYGWPSLWKTFTFKLTNSQLSMTTSPLTKFARKYGKYFKHVKIYVDRHECRHFPNIWYSWLIEFLEILTSNSELVSIEFEYLSYLLWTTECANMRKVIADFLGSQHQLERVEFFHCSFEFNDGVEFVRQLVRNNGESLRHLRLRGFVRHKTGGQGPFLSFTQNLPTLSDILNLTTLDIDYSLIFVNMFSSESVQTLKNCKTPALSKILLAYDLPLYNALYYTDRRDYFPGLKSADWLFLKTLLPNLQVELIIETPILTEQKLTFLITRNMPISRLEYMNGNIKNTVKLFDHLLDCQTIDNLVCLHLRMCPPDEDVLSPIIRFLPACKKLKFLELLVSDSTNIGDLIAYWVENPPEYLEKLILHISDIRNDKHFRKIQNLRSKYESQLKSLGLNVVVDIAYARDS